MEMSGKYTTNLKGHIQKFYPFEYQEMLKVLYQRKSNNAIWLGSMVWSIKGSTSNSRMLCEEV